MLARHHRVIGSSAFDPATLSLTGWWRASFAGSPWSPTASAGSSGTAGDLTGGLGTTPATGSAVNGLTPADFDGTDDFLDAPYTILDDAYNAGAYSGWALVYVDSISTDDANVYDNDCILSTQPSAYWILFLRSSGVVGIRHIDSGEIVLTATVSTGAWQLIQWKLDAGTLSLRVNGGTRQTTAAGNLDATGISTSAFVAGTNYGGAKFLNGKMLEIGLADSALSDTDEDNVLSYCRSRYALTLT